MSEYITLDSNVKSMPNFGDNSIAEFRTKLGRHVSLDGDWEVGLSEITYTKSWYNVLKTHKIILFDEIGNLYENEGHYIIAGFYDTPQKLITEINKLLEKITKTPPKLIYNELNNCVTIIAGKIEENVVYPYMGSEIENILGFNNRSKKLNVPLEYNVSELQLRDQIRKKDEFPAFHPVEISGGFHSLFLYSDIVFPSLIGDTCAPIMRVVEVPRKYKFGETIHINYTAPHYRPVMLNEFETIEISIKDDVGDLIPFKFGRCSLTLHFKKVIKGIDYN